MARNKYLLNKGGRHAPPFAMRSEPAWPGWLALIPRDRSRCALQNSLQFSQQIFILPRIIEKIRNKPRSGLTLVEMIVTLVLVTFLLGYAWKVYFGGRETMRHTVSQSQLQTETRIFFDNLNLDISSAYRFIEVDPKGKKFSFYRFQTSRRTLEDLYFDAAGKTIPAPKRQIDVLKVEYSRASDGSVKRAQIPGFLNIHLSPMTFSEGPTDQYNNTPNARSERIVLHNISDFEVRGYEQNFVFSKDEKVDPISIKFVDGLSKTKAQRITFIVLRIHNKIDEVGQRRDEELDIVGRFYSRVRLSEAAYPRYFCSTDEDFNF